jgi:hypothetical protein
MSILIFQYTHKKNKSVHSFNEIFIGESFPFIFIKSYVSINKEYFLIIYNALNRKGNILFHLNPSVLNAFIYASDPSLFLPKPLTKKRFIKLKTLFKNNAIPVLTITKQILWLVYIVPLINFLPILFNP